MTRLLPTLAAVLLSAGLSAQTQTQPPPPQTPPATTAPKAPDTIAGKWNVSVDTDNGPILSTLDIKLDGKKVSGTITSPQGSTAVNGEFADGKLTFTMTYDVQGGSLDVAFTGTLKDDGTIAGTVAAGQMGQFPFRAERPKDKH